MTVFNIKTLLSVAKFQKTWQKGTSQHLILTPLQIVDRLNKTPKGGKTKVYLNFEGFTFLYIDNYKHVFLPVFRVDVRNRDIQLENNASDAFYSGFKIEASYNNSRTARWEPMIEPCYFDIIYRSKEKENTVSLMAGSEDNQEALCFNISEELMEVVAHCTTNLQAIMDPQLSLSPSPKAPKHIEEAISESQFLVRNLTGYDFTIQTLGEKKSKPMTVSSQQEKFFSFIQDDEFTLKETINRSIILTFDAELGQSRFR